MLLLLGRALAVDWAPHGVNVNTVGLGVTATALNAAVLADPAQSGPLLARFPLHRPAADEVARWSRSWPPTPPAT